MDYDTNSEYGKIGSMVLYLVNSILALKKNKFLDLLSPRRNVQQEQ